MLVYARFSRTDVSKLGIIFRVRVERGAKARSQRKVRSDCKQFRKPHCKKLFPLVDSLFLSFRLRFLELSLYPNLIQNQETVSRHHFIASPQWRSAAFSQVKRKKEKKLFINKRKFLHCIVFPTREREQDRVSCKSDKRILISNRAQNRRREWDELFSQFLEQKYSERWLKTLMFPQKW